MCQLYSFHMPQHNNVRTNDFDFGAIFAKIKLLEPLWNKTSQQSKL